MPIQEQASVAFFMDYDRYGRDEAPAILQFVQLLRESSSVDFFSSEDELLRAMSRKDYDVVAISAFTSLELGGSLKSALKLKRADSGVVVIMGGHGVESFARELAKVEGVDLVVEGEADISLPLVLEHLERVDGARAESAAVEVRQSAKALGEGLEPLHVLKYYPPVLSKRKAESILRESFTRKVTIGGEEHELKVPISGLHISTGEGVLSRECGGKGFRKRAEELNPHMDYNEIKRHLGPEPSVREVDELYTGYPWDVIEAKGYSSLSLYVQRGCNWNLCSYCSIATSPGRKVSPEKVADTLEEAEQHGIREVTFEDDQFVQSSAWCSKILDNIIERGLNQKLAFGAMVRVDSMRKTMLRKMKEANFVKLQIGVESFLEDKIEYFNKVAPGREESYPARARALVDSLLTEGIGAGVFIITTRPKQKRALVEVCREVEEVLRLASSLLEEHSRLPTFSFSDFLMAYPGAPLLEREEYKRVLVPVRYAGSGKVFVDTLKLPYMFEFKSASLLGFFSSLREVSKKRGLAPEIKNETVEHLEDILTAVKLTAESLDSEPAVKLEATYQALNSLSQEEAEKLAAQLGVRRDELRGHLLRKVQSDWKSLARAVYRVSPQAWDFKRASRTAREEKEEVLNMLPSLEHMLTTLEMSVHREIKRHMRESREELRRAEESGTVREKLREVRQRANKLLKLYYPHYRGRSTLIQQLEWLEEYESSY